MTPPTNSTILAREAERIFVDGYNLPRPVFIDICSRLTYSNPEYEEAMRYGRWTGKISRTLKYYDCTEDGYLSIPRGAASLLGDVVRHHGFELRLEDATLKAPAVSFPVQPQLSAAQRGAVLTVLRSSMGQLVAPAGAGKTVMALDIIAQRRQPTLWLTHTKELAAQTRERAMQFLGLSADEIGMMGGGKRTIGYRLTIGMMQTLAKGAPSELRDTIGHIVVDECHRVPAPTMSAALTHFPAHYVLGLSATPYRNDRLDHVITLFLGPITAALDKADLSDRLIQAQVKKEDTDIQPWGDTFTEIVTCLIHHKQRNALIVSQVIEKVAENRRCLVLTERVDHAQRLADLLADEGIAVAVLHGSLSRLAREQARSRLDNGELAVIVATGQLIGEGFDSPSLDTLFLVTPLSYHGRLTQYLGRICRTAEGKDDALVIDYCDDHPMLWSSWSRRRDAYEAAEIPISRTNPLARSA